jgi:FkbM family methyltransferase
MLKLSEAEFISKIEQIPSCYFIEVGANDGVSNDPIYKTVIKNNLSGIVIEPNPSMIPYLSKNYITNKNVIVENSAVTLNTSDTKMFFSSGSNLHNTLSKNYAYRNFPDAIIETTVPGISFVDLLLKHNVTKVDLLLIDVEGYDFILLQSFPFDTIKPQIIRAEILHTTFENVSLQSMVDYLSSMNYNIYSSEDNTDLIAFLN